MTSKNSDQTVKLCGRVCKYMLGARCDNPMILCEKCPHYILNEPVELEKENMIKKFVSSLPNPRPYAKIKVIRDNPVLEVGIKGSF